LRWHDANNWPMLREALRRMGRADLIGPSKHHLIPAWQPIGTGDAPEGRRSVKPAKKAAKKNVSAAPSPFRTQHTGLKGVKLPKVRRVKSG
jgi:hypothetical protein